MSIVKKIDFRRALTILIVLGLLGLCTVLNLTRQDKSIAWAKPDAAKNSVNAKRPGTKVTAQADKAENLFLRVKGEFEPLDSIPKLEIRDKENYLVFKYEVKNKRDQIELEYWLEKDGKTIEEGFELKPPRIINLSRTTPQDSLKLDILSDSLFEQRFKGVELVISIGKGKEHYRIPISFVPKTMTDLRAYLRFGYNGEDIIKSTTLPFNTDEWESVQINNNTGEDISVSYQIAKVSSKGILLDAGTIDVDKGKAKNIPWGEKTPGISSVTLRFKVASVDETLDTTFVMNVSDDLVFPSIGRFFSRNWFTVLLILVIGGLGCLVYYVIGKSAELSIKLGSITRLVREKEKEIHKLKDGKVGLLIGSKNLETEFKQIYKPIGEVELGSSGDVAIKKSLSLSWDRYERVLSTLNLTRADFKNRIDELSDAQLKIKQLELQCSELNKKKTELEQELRSKIEMINQDEEKTTGKGKKKGKKKEFTISKADYDKICKEKNDLKSHLNELNDDFVKKQKDLLASNEEYILNESRLKTQIETLNSELEGKNEELEYKERELVDKYRVCAEMTDKIEELREKEKSMADDTNSLNLALAKAFMQISKLEETIVNLKNEVDISQKGTDIADETGSVKRNLERA